LLTATINRLKEKKKKKKEKNLKFQPEPENSARTETALSSAALSTPRADVDTFDCLPTSSVGSISPGAAQFTVITRRGCLGIERGETRRFRQ